MNTSSESLSARIVALVLCLALAFPVPVRANDQAGTPNVVHGGASINRDGDNLTVVTSTDRTIISWDKFGVPGGSTTHFAQPGVNSATLNRVQGSLPSHINGTLSSNGAVFITNPNGVVVGANGVVKTDGGFVASSLNISDADFLGGGPNGTASMRFTSESGYGTGAVENHGVVESAYGDVFLIGSRVANSGRVSAGEGTAGFAAGREVVIHPLGRADGRMEVVATEASFAGGTGVDNSGVVNAATAELRAHGDIYKLAVNNTGIIEARGVERTPDGRVFLTATGAGGKASGSVVNAGNVRALNRDGSGGSAYVIGESITLASGSTVDVSAESGDGGVALIGGAFQGAASHWQDADIEVIVPSATSVTMEAGAVIRADAAGVGDGGLAVLWSAGETRFDGSISARGGELAGDGGMVETSGRDLFVAGHVDTRAPEGKTGTYLLDPTNFTISWGDGPLTDSGIGANTLATSLATSNVTLHTGGVFSGIDDGSDAGDITVNADVTWNSTNTLTLNAHNDILISGEITADSGSINMVSGNDITIGNGATLTIGGGVSMYASNNITVNAEIRSTGLGGVQMGARNDILVNASIQNDGAGMVLLAAGWDGLTYNPNYVPADLDAMAEATWFGNKDKGDGSVIITNASVGSRNGVTKVFANDVIVGGSDSFGRIGFVASPGDAVESTHANGSIGVYAKGDVTVHAGANTAQIGHTWSLVPRTEVDTAYYELKTTAASIDVMAAGDISLTGAASYAQIGHGGGGALSSDTNMDINLQAAYSSITVTAGGAGGVALMAGTGGAQNAYARIGHGGALYAGGDTSVLTSRVNAKGSKIDVTAMSGSVSLTAGDKNNNSSQIGHGNTLYHDGDSTASDAIKGVVWADDAAVTVKAAGDVTLEAKSGINASAQIGHGGGVYSYYGSIGGISGSEPFYTVQAMNSSVSVTAGGLGGVDLTAGTDVNAYSRIGHGGALCVNSGTSALSSKVDAIKTGGVGDPGSPVIVEATSGGVSLTGGSEMNASSQIGHGDALRGAGGAMSTTADVYGASITVKANGDVTAKAGDANNAYAQIGHGGGMRGSGTKSATWTGSGGADIAVVANSLKSTGSSYSNASIGNIIYDNDAVVSGDDFKSLRSDAVDVVDTMLIRITSPTDLDNPINVTGKAGVYHGGSGSFSLLTDSTLNLGRVTNALNLSTHTGETNFVAGGDLIQGQSFTAGGAVNLLAGWMDEAGWSDTTTPMFKIGDAMAAPIDPAKVLSLYGNLTAKGNLHARAGTIAVGEAVTNNVGDFSLFRAEKSMTWDFYSSYSSDKADHQLILDLTKEDPLNDPAKSFNNYNPDVFNLTGDDARWLIWAETDLNVVDRDGDSTLGGLDKTKRQFDTVAPTLTHDDSEWDITVPTIDKFTGSGFVFTNSAPEIVVKSPGNLTYTYGNDPASAVAALKPTDNAGWAGLIDESNSTFILGDTLADITLTYTTADLETNATGATNVGAPDLYIRAKGYEATLGYGFDYQSGTVAVEKRAITVTASGTSIYGNEIGTISTVVTGDLVNGGITLSGFAETAATNTSNVGQYNITQGSIKANDGNDGNNYAITFIGDDGYTITKRAVTITVTGSGAYGEDPVIGYNATVGSIVNSDELTLDLDGTKNESGWYDAGDYDVVLGSSTTNDNYTITFANDDYTINRRSITVTGVTDSRQYGDANPSVGYTVGGSGLATGDSLIGSVNFNADGTSGTSDYTIEQGDVTNANNLNYDITWTPGLLTVTKRQITVTADAASRMMGQPNPEFTWSLSSGSMANDDTLTVSLHSDADANSPAGLYDIIMAAFSVAGVGAGNYQVDFVGKNRLTVTALPSESGNDINVYLPFPGAASDGAALADASSLRPQSLASLVGDSAGPDAAGHDAFVSLVNVGAISYLTPASARLASSFIITHEDWKALHPVEPADAIANYGAASAWRAEPFTAENASRTASGISLDEVRSLFLPHHAAPDGWEYHVEHIDTGEVDEDGNPVMGVRVTMVRRT